MRINNNIMAMNTHRQLGINNTAGAKSLEKLSSGYRINRAGDDAAGLSISEKMRGQIRGLKMASKNAQDGISLIQTAEGALAETHNMLQRMRELVVQSNNDTNTDADIVEIQKEIDELNSEITRIASKTEFNTKTLLDGTLGVKPTDASIANWNAAGISVSLSGVAAGETLDVTVVTTAGSEAITVSLGGVEQTIDLGATVAAGTVLDFSAIGVKFTFSSDTAIGSVPTDDIVTEGVETKFQIGANKDSILEISIGDMTAVTLGTEGLTITAGNFDANLDLIDAAIAKVSAQRSDLGAWQNRLEYTIRNLDTSAENLQAAESRIRDVDMAAEMMEFTKNNILQQAATAMLAQANMLPQSVLQLLG